MTTATTRARAARWGLLIVAVVSVALLVASATTNWLSARRLAETLSRGQAESFFSALRATARGGFGPGSQEDFARVVTAQEVAGLRYLALVERDGEIVRSAGTRAPGPFVIPPTGSVLRVADRVRVSAPPPHHRGPPPDFDAPTPPPHGRGAPPVLMAEFEPLIATDVERRATHNLFAALVVSALLLGAAVVMFRWSQQAEAAEAELLAKRHLAQLGEMSAVLAHEIRNPLASLKGHAQLLAEELPDDGKQRARAERVVAEASRLEALSTQLLDLSRSGRVDLLAVDPRALLLEASGEVGDARITIDTTSAPATAQLDPVWMRQVLSNVLRNAVQASPADARIDADLRVDAGALVFTVRDRGDGIPKGEEERMFDAFHTTRTRGTGLGLTIARRIVTLHGGAIRAWNHEAGGAVFEIRVPA